ncbi:hypothetical protein OQA88_5432 [Cercophora sp. LCS_1]
MEDMTSSELKALVDSYVPHYTYHPPACDTDTTSSIASASSPPDTDTNIAAVTLHRSIESPESTSVTIPSWFRDMMEDMTLSELQAMADQYPQCATYYAQVAEAVERGCDFPDIAIQPPYHDDEEGEDYEDEEDEETE